MARSLRSKLLHEQKHAVQKINKLLMQRHIKVLKPFWLKLFRPYSFLLIDMETGKRLTLRGRSATEDVITLRVWLDGISKSTTAEASK